MGVTFTIDEVAKRIAEEFAEDGLEVAHVGHATIAGTRWTYLLHERGIDLVRLVGEEDDEPRRMERRFLGPPWRLDYREEVTGRGSEVEGFIEAPILDEPIRLRPFPNEDLREVRALLREWARRLRRPRFARSQPAEHASN
jgi:hypothetical protein